MDGQRNISFFNDPGINLIPPVEWDKAKVLPVKLKEGIRSAVAKLLDNKGTDGAKEREPELERPKDTSFGDYSTNVAMSLAGELKESPRKLAEELAGYLREDKELQALLKEVSVAGPGFINLRLQEQIWSDSLLETLEREGTLNTGLLNGKRILLEYAHPNPFKAFHIGHLRNIILGESLLRLLKAMGAEVIPINYQGDVGMHIAKCLWAFRKVPESDYPKGSNERVALIAKCYTEGAAAYADTERQAEIKEINRKIYSKEDEQINRLWELGKQWSLEKFHELYNRVYSYFNREYMESEVLDPCMEHIRRAREKGILTLSEGAVVFKGDEYGLDTRVFLNSQGLPTYEGKELGLAHLEFSDWGNIDLCIHNVAVEQISFFKVTFKVQSLLDPQKYNGRQYHNAYEFVGLKSGKMSSRTGNVVLGEDILNEAEQLIRKILAERENFSPDQVDEAAAVIGVGAVKYSFLNISPRSYLAFDLEKSLNFEGDSGPYLQYTYARSNKMLKDSGGYQKLNREELASISYNAETLAVLKRLAVFKDTVIESTKHLAPNILSSYLFDLAQEYNLFYKKNPVLKESDNKLRSMKLMLTEATVRTLYEGLDLLGIRTLSEM